MSKRNGTKKISGSSKIFCTNREKNRESVLDAAGEIQCLDGQNAVSALQRMQRRIGRPEFQEARGQAMVFAILAENPLTETGDSAESVQSQGRRPYRKIETIKAGEMITD